MLSIRVLRHVDVYGKAMLSPVTRNSRLVVSTSYRREERFASCISLMVYALHNAEKREERVFSFINWSSLAATTLVQCEAEALRGGNSTFFLEISRNFSFIGFLFTRSHPHFPTSSGFLLVGKNEKWVRDGNLVMIVAVKFFCVSGFM